MADPQIRAMTAADLASAADMMQRGEWGDRTAFLRWAIGDTPCHPIVAEAGGRVLGTGVATAYGPVGWVGTIFVDPEARGEGIGRALTRAVIEDLEARGCRTMLLIASDHGRPLYEREGFAVQTVHRRFAAPGLADTGADPRLPPFDPSMLAAVLTLDRVANGLNREVLFKPLATPESTIVAVGDDGAVRGFLLRGPWGGASLVAPDPDDAVRLLDWRRRRAGVGGRAATSLAAANDAGCKRLIAEGWFEEPGGTRMIRGDAIAWRPEAVWGQLGGALG